MASTTPSSTSASSSSTTVDPVGSKLTTSKPSKKATTSTTKAPEDYEDYDFGFLKACKDGTRTRGPKGRRKCPSATTIRPSTELDDDPTTRSTSAKSEDDDDLSNEKIVRDRAKAANAKTETKDDYFTQMMKMMRDEKNPKKEEPKKTKSKFKLQFLTQIFKVLF